MNVLGAVVRRDKATRGPYYGVAGARCSITNPYDVERHAGSLLDMVVKLVRSDL